MLTGVVTRISDAVAFVWTPDMPNELLVDERSKIESDRLFVGSWIRFERPVGNSVLEDFVRIEAPLRCEVDSKNRLKIKTQISVPFGDLNDVVTVESPDFGRVGVFRTFPEMKEGMEYDAWVIRVPPSKSVLGTKFGVDWCLAKQLLTVRRPRVSIDSPLSAPPTQPNRLKALQGGEVFLIGLIVSEFGELLFVWTPNEGEGIVPHAKQNLRIGDWIRFRPVFGRNAQGYRYAAINWSLVEPLFVAVRVRNSVSVNIKLDIPSDNRAEGIKEYSLRPPIKAEFFGVIDDDCQLVESKHLTGKCIYATIERRKPWRSGGSVWNLKCVLNEFGYNADSELCSAQNYNEFQYDLNSLSVSSPTFASDALHLLMQNEGVRVAVKKLNPQFVYIVDKYLAYLKTIKLSRNT